MSFLPGVYSAKKKNGEIYYRSSITYRNKHISLGSYKTEAEANQAYLEANDIVTNKNHGIIDHTTEFLLSFHKWVVLINFRDNGIYVKNPIYLRKRYFEYYFSYELILKFDIDDLFFYSTHKIMKRGGYLFVSDYGMQLNILSRYGIKNFAVVDRDYRFVNGDITDYRYGNIEIINKYYGVRKIEENGKVYYIAKIHVNGDLLIGKYQNEAIAAIAYNKAAHILSKKGFNKNFQLNYIVEMNEIEYAKVFNTTRISNNIRNWGN